MIRSPCIVNSRLARRSPARSNAPECLIISSISSMQPATSQQGSMRGGHGRFCGKSTLAANFPLWLAEPAYISARCWKGSSHLHRMLKRLDPAAAGRIHANDAPKLIRAIEVCLASRQKMTELWRRGRQPLQGFHILRLGLDPARDALYTRINQRAEKMFASGLVEETARLLEKYGDSAGPLTSLGYKQAVQLLRGEIDGKTALQAAQQAHRNYAKRQMTWFRREPEVVWMRGFGDDAQVQEKCGSFVAGELRQPAHE